MIDVYSIFLQNKILVKIKNVLCILMMNVISFFLSMMNLISSLTLIDNSFILKLKNLFYFNHELQKQLCLCLKND